VDIPKSFIGIIILFNGPLEYGSGGDFQTTEVDAKLAPDNVGP
jgi:hypothetical protein